MMPTPAPSFDDPLGLLRACHERMQARLTTLERLPGHLRRCGADEAAREAAQQVLNYFERAAPHHHADEEQDLFPALQACAGRAGWSPELGELLAVLAAEHSRLEQGWASLRPALHALAGGDAGPLGERVGDIEAWAQAYRHHLAAEEADVLPPAARLLSHAELARLGAAMQARRRPEGQ